MFEVVTVRRIAREYDRACRKSFSRLRSTIRK